MPEPSRTPDSDPAPPPPSSGAPRSARAGLAVVLLIAAGALARLAFFASGRSPLDGDEAIMGMMGFDLRSLSRIPLYFYGQNYMGAIEIPVLSLVQLLGFTKAWAFSVWPIRLAACAYVAGLAVVHFRLTERLFGRAVALPAVLFLVLGPVAWLDYSSRLRHVVFMMMMGELMMLLLIGVMEEWNAERRVHARRVFLLGLLAGLAWWHYQLVLVFFLTMFVVLAGFSSFLGDLFRDPAFRPGEGSGVARRLRPEAALRLGFLLLPVAVYVAMTLGKGWSYWPHFEWILLGLGVLQAAALLVERALFRREHAAFVERADPALSPWGALQRHSPALVVLGFVLGSVPSIWYMATLDHEFWVHPTGIDLVSLLDRLSATFWTEVGPMLDLLRAESFDRAADAYTSPATVRSYFYILIYGMGGYALFRRFQRPDSARSRIGVVYVVGLAGIVVFLRAALPRNLSEFSPRFVIPVILPASIVFGLAIQELIASIAPAAASVALRRGAGLALGAVCVGMFALSWREAPAVELDLRSGHRKTIMAIARALEQNGVRRLYIEYRPGSDQRGWVPMGWELMYATRNEVRLHWATLDDRLWGLLDEDDYGWDEYYMYQKDLKVRQVEAPSGPIIEDAPGFEVEGYRVIRLPEGYAPHRGWLPWSPRGSAPAPPA